MREGCLSPIINGRMKVPRQPMEKPRRQASAPMVVAICGDPVVGRALALLLRGSNYDARFLTASSLGEPGALEGVRLLVLTPTWELDADSRKALLASLRDASEAAEAPILELTSSPGGPRNGHAWLRPDHIVSWPCSPEELERRIQAALLTDPDDLPRSATSGSEGA
jgi:hypothetical protein